MSRSLYLASAEPETGKSLIVLGVMNLLASQVGRVGFFRPIIHSGNQTDPHIRLVSERYDLPYEYDAMYGVKSDDALMKIQEGDTDSLITDIINKYKKLQKRCDFVLCEGTDFSGALSPFEFEFDARIANNLGTPLLSIISGHMKSVTEISDTAHVVRSILKNEKTYSVGLIVNRANEEELEAIQKRLDKIYPENEITFVISEKEILQRPTMRQIKDGLNASLVFGNDEALNHHIYDYKIAAMSLERILAHTSDGSLVVVPGDRTDVLLTMVMTLLSENYPHIGGILLTGGVKPDPYLVKLIDGLKKVNIAMLGVYTDTYTTAMRLNKIPSMLTPENERRLNIAIGHFENFVDGEQLARKISISRSDILTPIMFEFELFEKARSKRKHIVLPESEDERILEAVDILLRRNVVDITLLGNVEQVKQKTSALQIKPGKITIIDPAESELREKFAKEYYKLRKHKGVSEDAAFDIMGDVSYFGTMMVHLGYADGMVSGAMHTTQHTIRPAFEFVKTKPGVSIVSSSFFMCFEDRVLVYGDCAVNPNPNSEQLADIAISSAETAKSFGIEPRIAMLSYSTGESGKGEDVVKVREATRIARERRPDLSIEGPIQYDAAIDASVAKKKMPGSAVAGKATVFIFPDLNTGNNTYKAVQRAANAVAIGPVLQGLNKPVNDLSRGCLVKDIVNTVAITAIQAQIEPEK
ncbi:MAG: phosphate acetyltransferase [Bacteroidales bacterium]|nr:phosphate acetyltransferase [Bacteroidales bacterium]MCF8350587.1 phosphate acetyltransferase [Bacteroidales bacterium]MCF8377245.1 phosphate acetyltransferase [Bacteroidales bacterium]MCF8401991.1 phosphate acetyltransferase [Bacteroidales bacterium]